MAKKVSPDRPPSRQAKRRAKPDIATLAGIALALGGIVGGFLHEGGEFGDISQVTAGMIVLGGTIGAVLVTTPMRVVWGAIKKLKLVFVDYEQAPDGIIDEIIGYATKARKNGIVSLEQDSEAIDDPFLKKALNLAVDGIDLQELRKMMELEITLREHAAHEEAKVFEAAGGYAPTIGIIGAVLGLIQVMKNIENVEAVGPGIAVAFVATVYGIGAANLLFLPAANKIKARMHQTFQTQELILEGVAGIVEGCNPKLIRSKLEAYSNLGAGSKPRKAAAGQSKQAAAGQAAEAAGR